MAAPEYTPGQRLFDAMGAAHRAKGLEDDRTFDELTEATRGILELAAVAFIEAEVPVVEEAVSGDASGPLVVIGGLDNEGAPWVRMTGGGVETAWVAEDAIEYGAGIIGAGEAALAEAALFGYLVNGYNPEKIEGQMPEAHEKAMNVVVALRAYRQATE